MRIHVVGGPGSGKTTLARRLGEVFGVEPVDLDYVAYECGVGDATPHKQRRETVTEIALRDSFITEGIYIGWTQPLIDAADLVIWLDVPGRMALWRILSRHVRLSLAGTNKHKGILKLMRFMQWAYGYYHKRRDPSKSAYDQIEESRAATEWLYRGLEKVRVCRCDRDIEALLGDLCSAKHGVGF